MSSKAVLIIAVVSLTLLLVVATANENQEQGVDKRAPLPIQTPTTLANMAKVLADIQKRMKALEARQNTYLRGVREMKDPPRLMTRGIQTSGTQYVRWGKTTCPTGASLVYKGRIGGEWFDNKGGGANYVCLPENPKYGRYKDGRQKYTAHMHGAEYENFGSNLFNRKDLLEHDAPCAVCYVQTRGAKMMIPATYQCPAGWTREYHGYLMTQAAHFRRTEYICVDENIEAAPGTHTNLEGATLNHVEGRCGSLPCLPYVDGRELTCVVCTK